MVEGLTNGTFTFDKNLANSALSNLLRYFFEPPAPMIAKLKRDELIAALQGHLKVYQAGRFKA